MGDALGREEGIEHTCSVCSQKQSGMMDKSYSKWILT